MHNASQTARFVQLVQGPESDLRVDEAAALIAAHANPAVEEAAIFETLDDLAARCRPPTLDGLLRLLFVDEGFHGNTLDYYDPKNSFLDEVLERRAGIPITLAVVTMEVGRRAGVPLAAIGMPGHFLLRDRVDPNVFVDPFDQGPTARQARLPRAVPTAPTGCALRRGFSRSDWPARNHREDARESQSDLR